MTRVVDEAPELCTALAVSYSAFDEWAHYRRISAPVQLVPYDLPHRTNVLSNGVVGERAKRPGTELATTVRHKATCSTDSRLAYASTLGKRIERMEVD